MKAKLAVLAAILLLGVASVTLAASAALEMPWHAVAGGGGASAGGEFTLSGTAGQSAAGLLSGGRYTLAGGFWPGAEAMRLHYLPAVLGQ